MLTTFRMREVTLQLDHEEDSIAKEIENCFSAWRVQDTPTPSARFHLRKGPVEVKIPEGAIRTRYWPEIDEWEFRLGKTNIDIVGTKVCAVKDYENRTVQFTYLEESPRAKQLATSAFRWMLVKCLEQEGFGYIHASAAQ